MKFSQLLDQRIACFIVGLVTGGKMKTALPIAISNPVFVDVDGSGFTPNHDLLGKPLPTALKKKAKGSEVE